MRQQPSILEVERKQPDAARPRVGTAARGKAASLLRLQWTAGNRAVGALMAAREPRVLARCGSGRCHCGGACKREDDEEGKHLAWIHRGGSSIPSGPRRRMTS